MESKITDKLDSALVRLSDIKSTAIALSEALYYTAYESEVFSGAAALIANNIECASGDLCKLAEEITNA